MILEWICEGIMLVVFYLLLSDFLIKIFAIVLFLILPPHHLIHFLLIVYLPSIQIIYFLSSLILITLMIKHIWIVILANVIKYTAIL